MKHRTWNYLGWKTINEDLDLKITQNEWNCTLLTFLKNVIEDDVKHNFLVSKRIFEILRCNNDLYKDNNVNVFLIDIDTPKIYITKKNDNCLSKLKHNNYNSVTVINL